MPRSSNNPSGLAWEDFVPARQNVSQSSNSPESSHPLRGGCRFCKSRRLHRSSLRRADIGPMLLLRYPVRCLRCRQRQYADFLTAALSQPSGTPGLGGSKQRQTWSTWTSESSHKEANRERPISDTPPTSE